MRDILKAWCEKYGIAEAAAMEELDSIVDGVVAEESLENDRFNDDDDE